MNETTRPASWNADPTGRHQYRYWSGTEWTDQVADNGVTGTDPPTMPASPATTAPAPPAPGVAPLAPKLNQADPRRSANPAFAWVAVAGGVALAIGSFLDAATATAGSGAFSFEAEKNYIDGDGPITLVIGIVAVVLASLLLTKVLPRWAGWIVVFFGAVGALIAIADIVDVSDSPEIEAVGASVSIGPALWVCLVGGVAVVIGGGFAALLGHSESD